MLKINVSRKSRFLLVASIFLLLVNVSFVGINFLHSSNKTKETQKYPLLSKRLFVENQNDIIINLAPLRIQIREYLNRSSIPYSFYFEYLPSGTSIRAGDNTELVGASLMKLPVVMDLYKASELKKLSLDDMVVIDDQDLSRKFGLLWREGSGATIQLREAVRLALEESDNTAARVILKQTLKTLESKDRSLNFLDAELEKSDNGDQQTILISARSYSSFLKCLYLSCYLNNDNSQAILDLLTKTGFHSRIESGIADKSVKIAHKIGTYSQKSSSDCGIVYVPKRPYLFCLMINSTAGNVDKIIADVSKMAYEYIMKADTN